MGTVKYRSLFGECLGIVTRNRNLFVPNVLMILFSLFLIILFMMSSGIFSEIVKNPHMLVDQEVLRETIAGVKDASPVWFWSLFAVYVLIVYAVDMFFITAKYGMIKEVLESGKTTVWGGMKFGATHYFRSFSMHLISYFLVISPLFFVAALAVVIGLMSSFFQQTIYVIAFAIFILIVFVYWVEIFFRLLFLYPIMAFEGTTSLESFKEDFHYVKSHVAHTFISWMIAMAIWIAYFLFKNPIGFAARQANSYWLILLLTLLALTAEMVISTFEHTFIFKSYIEGKDVIIQRRIVSKNWKDIYT